MVIEHSHVVEARSTAAVTLAFERQLSRLDVRLHKMRYTPASVMTTRPLAIKRVSQTIELCKNYNYNSKSNGAVVINGYLINQLQMLHLT